MTRTQSSVKEQSTEEIAQSPELPALPEFLHMHPVRTVKQNGEDRVFIVLNHHPLSFQNQEKKAIQELFVEFWFDRQTLQVFVVVNWMSPVGQATTNIFVDFLNAIWDQQNTRSIPTDIRWEDFAPEKVMLRFKEELQRLQPYVEGWFSERGKSLPDWPKIYFVPVEGWFDYFNGHSDAAKLPEGRIRDDWIANQALILSAICPWRYTQGIYLTGRKTSPFMGRI